MIGKGRVKLLSQYNSVDIQDISILAKVVNRSMEEHLAYNYADINYLIDYKNGKQTILTKEKTVRDEVNNKLVINHAQMITRMVNGYFLGTPIQYILNGDSIKQTQIDLLNKYVSYEDKPSVDKEIGEYQSICGTAYRIIYTDGVYADEVPFEEKCLDPTTTFVVYENDIAERPLMGVTFYYILDDKKEKVGSRIYVHTTFGVFDILTTSSLKVDENSTINFTAYDVGGIPVIEYPNNIWRIGDWELCIGLMDAINALQSGRLDDIDQIVQSLIVFINAEIDSDVYDEMREKGVVMLKNMTGQPTDVKPIVNTLDQQGMSKFSEELESLVYAMIGIPDRNNRSGSGGDTGTAVELRDGWADMEIVARNKELVYKRSEKQALKIILKILQNKDRKFTLTLLDVDIKFSRNKNNNLLVKTQSYQTLIATKTLSPADCLTIVDLVSDVNEFISRGETFWGASFAGLEASNAAVDNLKNPPEPTTAQNAPVKKPDGGTK